MQRADARGQPAEPRGPEGLRARDTHLLAGCQDQGRRAHQQGRAGDRALTSGGTYAGTDFAGAKGRKISFPGTSVFTITDGKIAGERCSWDTLDVLRQLGVEATPDTRDTMIANAQRLLHDVYGKGDYAALSQILADDYVMHVPSLRGESTERGAASVEKRVKAFRSALPDIKYEIHQIMVSGDTLVMRWSFRGTHRGELLGVAPSNKPVEITGMSMTRTRTASSWRPGPSGIAVACWTRSAPRRRSDARVAAHRRLRGAMA